MSDISVYKHRYIIIYHSPTRTVIREHILLFQIILGRPLREDETIHHKNGNKYDNRLCNLELISRADHQKLHISERC